MVPVPTEYCFLLLSIGCSGTFEASLPDQGANCSAVFTLWPVIYSNDMLDVVFTAQRTVMCAGQRIDMCQQFETALGCMRPEAVLAYRLRCRGEAKHRSGSQHETNYKLRDDRCWSVVTDFVGSCCRRRDLCSRRFAEERMHVCVSC